MRLEGRWGAGAKEDRRLGIERCARAGGGRCRERGAGGAWFRACSQEEPNGSGGLVSLGHGLVLGCKLGEEGIQACGRGRSVAVFMAEIEIEAHPLAAVGALGCRDPSLVQTPLKGGPYLCGNLLHGNALG